jgi:hypothetical protein
LPHQKVPRYASLRMMFRSVQNRAYGPVLRQSRPLLTLRAQKTDHYMLRVRIKIRSGTCAAPA